MPPIIMKTVHGISVTILKDAIMKNNNALYFLYVFKNITILSTPSLYSWYLKNMNKIDTQNRKIILLNNLSTIHPLK